MFSGSIFANNETNRRSSIGQPIHVIDKCFELILASDLNRGAGQRAAQRRHAWIG